MSVQLRWTEAGAVFQGVGAWGATLADAFPLPLHVRYEVPASLRVLDRLLMDGVASADAGGVLVPFEQLYDLEPFERVELGLPRRFEAVQIRLRTTGFVGLRGAFAIVPVVSGSDGTVIPGSARVGAWIDVGREGSLISRAAYQLLSRIDAGRGDTLEDQHRFIAEVTQLAKKCDAELDQFLRQQEYVVPNAVGVEVEGMGPDRLILRPVVEGVEDRFDGFENGAGAVRTTYTKRDGARRRRLILSEKDRDTAKRIRDARELTGADVPRFLENPEAFLPDEVDLSRFSPRVRGLIPRRYRSQPYLDVREGQQGRDWFAVSPRIELLGEDALGKLDPPSTRPSPPWNNGADPPAADETRTGDADPAISAETYADLCRNVIETGERHILHDGTWITIEPDTAKRFLSAIKEVEVAPNGEWRVPRSRIGYVLDVISNVDQLEFSLDVQPPDPVEPPSYPLPAGLTAELYAYQAFGYRWLRYLHENSFGGLLADEMGLGKTVQLVALLAYLAEARLLRPTLVVVPNSLVPNWRRELGRFCPQIKLVHEHHGPDRNRNAEFLAQWDVVVTTYGTLRRDQLILAEVDWQVVACDEAQNAKNPTTQVTSALKALKAHLRVALTGTPVENGLSELWCIVDFVQPGKLGSWANFRRTFERPLVEASTPERALAARRLQEELVPHYVRRLKADVLSNLPPKNEERHLVPLGEHQSKLYARVIADLRAKRAIPLAALQQLIQIASHPTLVDELSVAAAEHMADCPKLRKTCEIVGQIRSVGEKVVIFTRFRRMQDILQDVLAAEFGVIAPIINGEDAGRARQARVDAFNAQPGFGAMILSPEAAGVGLNITGANHVIHYTRLWNPAKENQATDRVHRLGQARPVTVHYPIVVGDGFRSIEEHLDQLLAEKSELARNVLWPRESLSVVADLERVIENEAADRGAA